MINALKIFIRTVLRVLDAAVLNVDLLNSIIRASTDRADRDPVTSSALGSGEGDILDKISTYSGLSYCLDMRTVPELTAKQSSWLWTTGLVI